MGKDLSLINLGELSKPATVLIEKISDALGGIFKPYQIVRVAKAEAEADRIRAESQIQISDLHRRALHRFLEEEAKKQKNIEEIVRRALPELDEKARPQDVEDDWITNFFDKCRIISDGQMQLLWSRVLAGEANSPGAFSKRTVGFLSSLDKTDAELFTALCTFVWVIDGPIPLVFDVQQAVYAKHQICYEALAHLDSIGLIRHESVGTFYTTFPDSHTITVYYYEKPTTLQLGADSERELDTGGVMLTRVGQQLAPICGSQPDAEFHEYVLNRWKAKGYIKGDNPDEPAPLQA